MIIWTHANDQRKKERKKRENAVYLLSFTGFFQYGTNPVEVCCYWSNQYFSGAYCIPQSSTDHLSDEWIISKVQHSQQSTDNLRIGLSTRFLPVSYWRELQRVQVHKVFYVLYGQQILWVCWSWENTCVLKTVYPNMSSVRWTMSFSRISALCSGKLMWWGWR